MFCLFYYKLIYTPLILVDMVFYSLRHGGLALQSSDPSQSSFPHHYSLHAYNCTVSVDDTVSAAIVALAGSLLSVEQSLP